MKILIFLFIVIALNCKAAIIDNCKIEIINNFTDSVLSNKKELFLGSWSISKTITVRTEYRNGQKIEIESETVCNICPTIIFKKDGLGILINAVGEETYFKWLILNAQIVFSFEKNKDKINFFSLHRKFNFKIYKDSINLYVELFEPIKKYKYILIGTIPNL